MIIDPRPMTAVEWMSQMTPQLDPYGPVMRADTEQQWRDWALNACQLLGISQDTVNPYNFTDWRQWAIRFSQVAEPLLNV